MNTALFTHCHYSALVLDKQLWMRVNRALAWALVASPVLQILLRTDLARGLWLDLAILMAHAALSLALFGLPQYKNLRKTVGTRWFGLSELGMSPRNQFLLGAWRMVVSVLWLIAIPCAVFAWGWLATVVPQLQSASVSVGVGVLVLPLFSFSVFYWLLLQHSLITHLYQATGYALRRWGYTHNAAPWVARALVAVFVYSSIVNLFRPLWR